MKRIALVAALLATPLFAQAQWAPYDDDRGYRDYSEEVEQLEDELDRLREDPRIADYADPEIARAEDYIEDLAGDLAGVTEAELRTAEGLLANAERAGLARYAEDRDEPEVVVIEDRDEEARYEARESRRDALRAREQAEAEREAALAAQLEAERQRTENARLRTELGARETDRGLVVTLGDVLFASGQSTLRPGAARTLDKLVAAMRRDRDTTVTIEGHTDSTGKRAYNLALSQKRANAVRNYLTSKGVPGQRIKARGLGPDFPVATNRTEAGRQQNRRVELLVQNDVGE